MFKKYISNMQKESSPWQDLIPRDRMEYLLSSGHLSDCSFIVFTEDNEKITLKCHRFVLMCASPVFERMFEGDFEESRMPENIILDDVSANDFKTFIDYLYWQDNHKIHQCELSTMQNLIYLSRKFMVTSLTSLCISTIASQLSSMNVDTTIDLYEYAYQIDHKGLISHIDTQIKANQGSFINSSAMFDLSSEIFLKFMSLFNDNIREVTRFKAIESYCKVKGLVQEGASPKQRVGSNDILVSVESIEDGAIDTKSIDHCSKDVKDGSGRKPEVTVIGKSTEKDENDIDAIDPKTGAKGDIGDTNKEKPEETEEQRLKNEFNRKQNEEQRKEYIKKLVKLVSFGNMTSVEFCLGPGRSQLLDIQEKFDLLAQICTEEHSYRKLRKGGPYLL